MIGATPAGARMSREPAPTRWSRRDISLDELTGLGPKMDRYAVVLLLKRQGWPASRIGNALGITKRRVEQVIRDFRERFPEVLAR